MTSPDLAFDRRLAPSASATIAVAYSGGGDSLMALKLTKAWADRHGRTLTALSVDHGLQTASSEWIAAAGRTAKRLGVAFQALPWTGDKPEGGLPDAARQARHRLIAEAARGLGAKVVVFGHTADDILEGDLMRGEGHRLGLLREWSPSPVWPEGRGLFLLRPLLGLRRADIRDALSRDGESWIDDPSNADTRSPRARARIRLREGAPTCAPSSPSDNDSDAFALASQALLSEDGAIRLCRQRLREAPIGAIHRVLAAAVTCAGGRAEPPRGTRLRALADRLLGPDPFTATLSGAKIMVGEQILIVRDDGEVGRGGLAAVTAIANQSTVWDGRFEVFAHATPVAVRALTGQMKALSDNALLRLKGIDPAVRPSLPLIETVGGGLTCPILAQTSSATIRSLIGERFLAACGGFSKEGAT